MGKTIPRPLMKLLVETTGSFQLLGPGFLIPFDRPAVVAPSSFVQSHQTQSRLKVLGQVNDEATDTAFVDTLKGSKGDVALAVAAFLSEFPETPTEKPDQKAPSKASK